MPTYSLYRRVFAGMLTMLAAGAVLAQNDSPGAATQTQAQSDAAGAAPAGGAGLVARLADAPIVPVHDEPHHRQLFQYGPTRILELQLPPADISWYHTHEWPVLYLTLGSSTTRTQNLGAEPGAARGAARGAAAGAGRGGAGAAPGGGAARAGGAGGARPGGPGAEPGAGARGAGGGRGDQTTGLRAFSTTNYFENPVTHFVENLGTGLFHAMVVINETAGDPDDTVASTGFTGEPELTNRWFRSYRVTLAPGETMAAHRHETPVVILQATAGTGRSDGPMPFEFNKLGQWGFYDKGVEHSLRNSGDAALEWLEVEVRIVP